MIASPSEEYRAAFGKRLEIARETFQWTGAQVGEKVGVTRQVICNWEKGRNLPDPENLVKLAVALDRPVEWLATGKIGEKELSETWETVRSCLRAMPEHKVPMVVEFMKFLCQSRE